MNISANSLFHFTRERDNLLNILGGGFYPRYCIEDVRFSFEDEFQGFAPTEIAIPMVCFCDILLSQIRSHIRKFGSYAVGMTLEWGIRNGLNPLMYVVPDSNPMKIFRDSISGSLGYPAGRSADSPEREKLHNIGDRMLYLVRYLKPYSGKRWDGNGFNGGEVKFYDEREWRYIPDYYEMQGRSIKPYLKKEEYLDDTVKKHENAKLTENFALDFKPGDVRYIIVDREVEIPGMIAEIDKIKKACPDEERKLLFTKLISMDRLQEDF